MDVEQSKFREPECKMYEFLLKQSKMFILNAWLKEAFEKKKLLNFVHKKGLFLEFSKFKDVNF